jgi:hypothetical protein
VGYDVSQLWALDRVEVIKALAEVVPHRYLFGPQDRPCPQDAVAVLTWDLAEAAILNDLV